MTTRPPKKTPTAAAVEQVTQQPAGEPAGGQEDAAAEEAAHLQRLQEAAATEEANPGGPDLVDVGTEGTMGNAPRVDLGAEIGGLMRVAVAMLGPMFPSLRDVYTDEAVNAAASVSAALCQKHGWLQEGIGGKYKEELAAVIVLGPLAVATYGAVTKDLAAQAIDKAKRGEVDPLPDLSAPVPDAPASAKVVTFGAQVQA